MWFTPGMATKINSDNKTKLVSSRILATTPHVLLDRLQLQAWPRGDQLPEIPGFATQKDSFARRQTSIRTYYRVRVLKNAVTQTVLYMQYRPAVPWLPPAKISVVTQARRGLRPRELEIIARAFKKVRLLLIEFAVDFPPGSGIDQFFVQRHAMFRRSEQRHGAFANLRFGARKSEKLVRAYLRDDWWYRVELELHAAWLRRYRVVSLPDLSRLPALLLPRHFCFFAVDWNRLAAHVLRRNPPSADHILAQCRKRATSLERLLTYLRDEVRLQNVRRLLRPLRVNDAIKKAAIAWACQWAQSRTGGR